MTLIVVIAQKKIIPYTGYIAIKYKLGIKKLKFYFFIHLHVKIYPFLTSTLFQYILEYDISRFGYTFLYTKRGRIQRGIYFYSSFGYFIYPILYIYFFYLKKYIQNVIYMFFYLIKNISETRYIFFRCAYMR